MIAFTIVLIALFLFVAFVYGRALVYARSEEYKLNERIKHVIK